MRWIDSMSRMGAVALTAVVSVFTFASTALAATLKVGDPAPALTVGKWAQGDPVEKIEEGKIYVVEFWATWCGPCRATIPHLNELSKKHKDVVFIGANVWERDESLVEPFVKQMGDKMTYRVAFDDKSKDEKGAMATNWMEAAGQNGIPAAFIIGKDARIAWIGHPASMDDTLQQIVDGKFDAKAAAEKAERAAANADKVQALGEKINAAGQAQNWDEMISLLDEMAKLDEENGDRVPMIKFRVWLLGAKQPAKAYAMADELLEAYKDNAQALNGIAYLVVDDKRVTERDYAFAEKLALKANELTHGKDAAILDTVAAVYFGKGDTAKAIEWQTKAVEAAPAGEMKDELTKTLEKYKAKG